MSSTTRVSRSQRILLLAVALLFLLCAGSRLLLVTPRYLVLRIDPPMADLPNGGWAFEGRPRRTWIGDHDPFYVWRATAVAFPPAYEDWRDVASYIERQLVSLGWEPAYVNCADLPEASFLHEGENGYIGFARAGSDPEFLGPTVCLAIWSEEGSDMFNVVIQSANPSPLLRIARW